MQLQLTTSEKTARTVIVAHAPAKRKRIISQTERKKEQQLAAAPKIISIT